MNIGFLTQKVAKSHQKPDGFVILRSHKIPD
jgi:hypothetical protein